MWKTLLQQAYKGKKREADFLSLLIRFPLLYRTPKCCKFYDKQISSLMHAKESFFLCQSRRRKDPKQLIRNLSVLLGVRLSLLIRLRWIFHGYYWLNLCSIFREDGKRVHDDDFSESFYLSSLLGSDQTFSVSLQFFNGIHMFSLKCLLNNSGIWGSSNCSVIRNGDYRSDMVFNRIFPKVSCEAF